MVTTTEADTQAEGDLPPAATRVMLQQMIAGYVLSQSIYVAAKLGVADLVAHGAKTAEQLGEATGADPSSLYRFLRALASVAVFSQDDEGRFGLGPLGRHLRSDVPGSLRAYAIHANEECYQAWGRAVDVARSGRPGFEQVFGQSFYGYMADHADADQTWNESMADTGHAWSVETGTVGAYDWTDSATVVDVGGGRGTLVAAILNHAPHLRGVVFDLPHVVAGAKAELSRAGVEERCQVVAGSFFERVPPGDTLVLSRVLFNWDDQDCVTILRHCRAAIGSGGRVLVVEPVAADGNVADLSNLIDLNVFVVCGGRTRTAPQLDALFQQAGLKLNRLLPTPGPFAIVEACSSAD
jgi:O-methyltransferase domain/Dimerisation domain